MTYLAKEYVATRRSGSVAAVARRRTTGATWPSDPTLRGRSGRRPAGEAVAAELSPSVAQVNVEAIQTTPCGPQEERGLGSGVIYREDRYIINSHVAEDAAEVNVAFADGSVEEGEVVGTNPRPATLTEASTTAAARA